MTRKRREGTLGATSATILLILAGCHQPPGDLVDRRLIGDVMLHSELTPNLRALARPGGRLTGTANAENAEQFVADKLRSYGLRDVHFEPFGMSCWASHRVAVTVLADPPRVLDGAVALARTQSTPVGGVIAPLIDLDQAKEDDFTARGAELRGRIVLLRDGHGYRGRAVGWACAQGAAGVVFMAAADHAPTIGNGHSQPRPEPAVVIPYDADLLAQLAAGESPNLRIELEAENWDCRPNNVVGEIPGHGPLAREIVILCAHLDSWHLAEGAMDNGSGSAVVLETARALACANWRPRRTIRFIWFMSEELGLTGSASYVQQHRNEMDRIVAVINVDMPGAPRNFVVFDHPEIEPFLLQLSRDLPGYDLDPNIAHWHGSGSDHAAFVEQGVCALSVAGDAGPGVKYYHTPGDTFETVDRRAIIPTAALLSVLTRRLADIPVRPAQRAEPAPVE